MGTCQPHKAELTGHQTTSTPCELSHLISLQPHGICKITCHLDRVKGGWDRLIEFLKDHHTNTLRNSKFKLSFFWLQNVSPTYLATAASPWKFRLVLSLVNNGLSQGSFLSAQRGLWLPSFVTRRGPAGWTASPGQVGGKCSTRSTSFEHPICTTYSVFPWKWQKTSPPCKQVRYLKESRLTLRKYVGKK